MYDKVTSGAAPGIATLNTTSSLIVTFVTASGSAQYGSANFNGSGALVFINGVLNV